MGQRRLAEGEQPPESQPHHHKLSDSDDQPEVGFDLDGTLAKQTDHFDPQVVGELIPESVEKIRLLEKMGYKVWIFTARTDLQPVARWAAEQGLNLPVTNRKRPQFVAIVDDRFVPPGASAEETVENVKRLHKHVPRAK